MINTEEQKKSVDFETAPVQAPTVPTVELLKALWRRRRFLAKVIGIGTLLAIGFPFTFTSEFQSTAQLMPPDENALSSSSLLLSALTGERMIMPGATGGLFSGRTLGGTTIGMLSSRTVEDHIIDRFGLMKVYHAKLHQDARRRLAQNTEMSEDRKSGLITLTVTDEDPNRARDIAAAYIEELNNITSSLSASSARLERVFLESRLKTIKDDLDASTHALSQFSSRNATFDPQKQGEATVGTAERLQAELIAAQSELSGLKAVYADDNMRVRQARGRIDELRRQLNQMAGTGKSAGAAAPGSGQLLPSVRDLPILGATYYDLYRKVTMEETLYEALSKQYEFARVQEAQEVQSVKVLDGPDVAEKRMSKHRIGYAFWGMILFTIFGVGWVVLGEYWRLTDDSHPAKALAIVILRSTRLRKPASSH